MQTKITLDEANRQYVINTFEGYSVLSYQSCYDNAIALAEAMRKTQGGNPLRLDFIGVSSYGAGTESGELVFTKELRIDVRNREVLLVDDILDTGKTLSRVLPKLKALKPRRIKTCVLLNKAARREEKIQADYVGFEIPDFFVIGYGLDFAERYRNLPFVGVLHPHIYKDVSQPVLKK